MSIEQSYRYHEMSFSDIVASLIDVTTSESTIQDLNALPVGSILTSDNPQDDIFFTRVTSQPSFDRVRQTFRGVLDAFIVKQGYQPLLPFPLFPTNYAREFGEKCDRAFSIVQFNMLADNLSGAHPSLGNFVGPPPECLAWEYRKWRIVEYLLREDADLICMEEVDMQHYQDFFGPLFAHLGYSSVYKPKNAPTSVHSEARDGCLILSRLPVTETFGWRLGETHNQIAVACTVTVGAEPLLVVATHLKSSKTAHGEEIRQQQVATLLNHIENTIRDRNVPVLICADLNASYEQSVSTPYAPQAYPLIVGNKFPEMFSAYCAYGDHESTEGLCIQNGRGEAPYTTCKTRGSTLVKHTIDFVFASKGLYPLKLAGMPQDKDLPEYGLPAWIWPSDHLPLHVCFTVGK